MFSFWFSSWYWFSTSKLFPLGDILNGDAEPESRPLGGEPANGLLLLAEIFLCDGIGLLLAELDLLGDEEIPFKLNSSSFLKCSMEVTDLERGIAGEGWDLTTPSSILSNRGSVAHFLMPFVECSSLKTSDDTRDERLPVGELSYPLLEIENWRDCNGLSKSPWENSPEFGRGDVLDRDTPLERGRTFLFAEGVFALAGTEIDRLVFVSGAWVVLPSLFSLSGTPFSSMEFRFGFLRTDLWTFK